VHYEKVFNAADGEQMLHRLPGYLSQPGVTAVVFNFVDMLTHGRSESAVLLEVARDKEALRALTRQWFERSEALSAIREAIRHGRLGAAVTTDHGSIHCHRPATVFAKRDATQNLRYKFGEDLRAEDPSLVFAVNDERVLRFPPGRPPPTTSSGWRTSSSSTRPSCGSTRRATGAASCTAASAPRR
jgi:hypothetical protein